MEYGKIVGLAMALANIAEQHRQWADHGDWSAIQGRYARLTGELELEIKKGRVVSDA
jgi:hypothetical protein